MRRNDPRMLVVRAAESLVLWVPFMLAQGAIADRLPPSWVLPWNALVVYYCLTRVSYIAADWLTVTW